jgi:DNA-binding NarL/FixJ family response regulator
MSTIWIVEDHTDFRRTLKRLLNAEAGLSCPHDFNTCEAALAALTLQPAPDLVLLDVGLPGMSGLEGIRLIRRQSPGTAVVILTVFEDDDKVFAAVCAGAVGYLLKTADASAILQAVREALAGGSPVNPRIARRVLDMFAHLAPRHTNYRLSEREKEILQWIVAGMIKKQISEKLQISVHTVDTYLRRIYEKLEVKTRTGAVAKALRENLV